MQKPSENNKDIHCQTTITGAGWCRYLSREYFQKNKIKCVGQLVGHPTRLTLEVIERCDFERNWPVFKFIGKASYEVLSVDNLDRRRLLHRRSKKTTTRNPNMPEAIHEISSLLLASRVRQLGSRSLPTWTLLGKVKLLQACDELLLSACRSITPGTSCENIFATRNWGSFCSVALYTGTKRLIRPVTRVLFGRMNGPCVCFVLLS